MKRVFYIDPQSYNNLSVYDYNLVREISGVEIVYFHNIRYQLEKMPCPDSRAVFSYSGRRGPAKALSYAAAVFKIALAVIRERPAVVHIQWFRLFAVDALFVKFLRALGIRIVHTAHNVLPHNPRPLDRRHYAWYYRHADAVIVHTESSAVELRGKFSLPAEKTRVIPHGMLPSAANRAEVEKRRLELEKSLGTKGKTVFAAMGYQNRYKGVDIISDVWCSASGLRDNDGVMLLVVGKVRDADLSALGKCRNAVVVDDIVPDEDFDAYLSLASAALLPYREISQSGVLFTCLSRGVPVVVSSAGGLADPLGYARVGWNMGPATAENLEKTLSLLAAHPEEISAVRNDTAAFNRVREVYSWENIARKTSELYLELAR